MATPANWEQFQEDMGRWQAAAEDLARRYEQLIDVANSGELGALAFAPDLSSAPMGSLSEMQRRLQIQNVANRGTVGSGARIMREGAAGWGISNGLEITETTSDGTHDTNKIVVNGCTLLPGASTNVFPVHSSGDSLIHAGWGATFWGQIGFSTARNELWMRVCRSGNVRGWEKAYTTGNTTRDSNGNLRAASPIFRVAINTESAAGDGFEPAGSGMRNNEAPGVTCERIEAGVYVVSDSLGFDTNDSWPCGFTIPTDANGNAMLFAESEQADDGTITIRTYEPLKDPQGWNVGGDPMDVPEGRFIALRLKMPAPPSDEYPDEEPAPELTPEEQEQERLEQLERWRANATITPRQARLVLSRHGLLKGVSDAIAGIDDNQERETVEIEWEYAVEIARASSWVNTLYSALGLSQEDVDELFREAAQI
ncbi:phage tail fiber protein [Vreelandella sp. GE22]